MCLCFFQHNYRLQAEKVSVMSQVSAVIAQLVERPTEKPGAILTWDRVPGVARDFFFISQSQLSVHTPSIAFRHLPPNSARFSYATEGALFISAQLSTDAVSALGKVWVWKTVEAT